MVVCSGTKPILDLSLTMEYLETSGVPVVGYCTDRMPEYMVRGSGFRLTYRMDTPEDLAEVMHIKDQMGIPGGVLVVNPVPKEYELDPIRRQEEQRHGQGDHRLHDGQDQGIPGERERGIPEGLPDQQRAAGVQDRRGDLRAEKELKRENHREECKRNCIPPFFCIL